MVGLGVYFWWCSSGVCIASSKSDVSKLGSSSGVVVGLIRKR